MCKIGSPNKPAIKPPSTNAFNCPPKFNSDMSGAGDNTSKQKGAANTAVPITNNVNVPILGGSVNGDGSVIGSIPVLGSLVSGGGGGAGGALGGLPLVGSFLA